MGWPQYRIIGSHWLPPDSQEKDWAGLKTGASPLSGTGMHEMIIGHIAPLDPPLIGNESLTILATEVEVRAANPLNHKAFM